MAMNIQQAIDLTFENLRRIWPDLIKTTQNQRERLPQLVAQVESLTRARSNAKIARLVCPEPMQVVDIVQAELSDAIGEIFHPLSAPKRFLARGEAADISWWDAAA